MTASVKRRSAERKKTQKSANHSASNITSLKNFSVGPKGWGDEMLTFLFLAVAFFMATAIVSQQYQNAKAAELLMTGELYIPKNLVGRVGTFLATMLLGAMGICAYVPVFWSLWIAWFYWTFDARKETVKDSSRPVLIVGLCVVLLFSCGLIYIVNGKEGGGSLGQLVAEPLLRLFDVLGASLILIFGLTVSLAVVSRQSVLSLLRNVFIGAGVATAFTFVTLPLIIFKFLQLVSIVSVYCARYIGRLITGHAESGSFRDIQLEEPLKELPKPRVRKNTIAEVKKELPEALEAAENLEESEEPDSEEVEDEDFSHIVVSRKKTDFKLAGKGRGSFNKLIEQQQTPKESLAEQYRDYVMPDISLLTKTENEVVNENDDELIQTSKQIESKLKDFNIHGRVTQVHPGPVITLYEFEPAAGVKVNKISALQDDLAMSLRAVSLRILAPIPKRGTVGIEVPNRHREIVRLRDVLESEAFVNAESSLSIAIGKDTYGDPVVVDIAQMPHLLMAGTTGTGKSVCINTILVSLLYRANPAELGLILIDPKILELSVYEGIPHLRVPVVTNAKQARAVLDWAVKEMERRYRLMQKYGVRNIDGYNKVVKGEIDSDLETEAEKKVIEDAIPLHEEAVVLDGTIDPQYSEVDKIEPIDEMAGMFQQKLEALPKIVIVIDELADLMLTVGREIEELITRLAQKARAAGIHLIVATQRPSVDVITGLIKANFPARLSFRVSSRIDSRTILDSMGADKLLGKGDMLFMLPGNAHLKRVHGAFIADSEVKKVIGYLKKNSTPHYDEKIIQMCEKALLEDANAGEQGAGGDPNEEYDSFYDKAVELVVQKGQASTSMIQRTFRIGYNRAARIIETMEREGIIGPMDGVKPRDVLLQNPE